MNYSEAIAILDSKYPDWRLMHSPISVAHRNHLRDKQINIDCVRCRIQLIEERLQTGRRKPWRVWNDAVIAYVEGDGE